MTDDRSLERAARTWIEAGPTEAPDRAVEAALLRIQTTPQERDLRIPWRFPKMTTPARVAAVAVIGVLVVGGAFFMLGRPNQSNVGGPGPTAISTSTTSPNPVPSASASQSPIGEGPLPAGQHMAKPFAPPNGNGVCHDPPQPGCSDTARDDTIRFTFTVPDGWASNDSGAWISKPATGVVAPTGMGLLFQRGGWLYSDPCINVATQELPDIPVGPSVDDFANALANHPLLDATTPTSISLGGYSGKYVDLQLPSDITCTFGYYPWAPSIPALGPSHKFHLWILDVEGIRVVVQTADFAGTTVSDLAELQAIVDSIQIEP
jgi:hypothetical protein